MIVAFIAYFFNILFKAVDEFKRIYGTNVKKNQ